MFNYISNGRETKETNKYIIIAVYTVGTLRVWLIKSHSEQILSFSSLDGNLK